MVVPVCYGLLEGAFRSAQYASASRWELGITVGFVTTGIGATPESNESDLGCGAWALWRERNRRLFSDKRKPIHLLINDTTIDISFWGQDA